MVEWARLESVCGSNVTVGSNPTLSAILRSKNESEECPSELFAEKNGWKACGGGGSSYERHAI